MKVFGMPVTVSTRLSLKYLQQFLVNNKARGMVAELSLRSELSTSTFPSDNKLFAGGWLLSPKVQAPQIPQHYCYLVFVLPLLYADDTEIQQAVEQLERDRGWQALATGLYKSGIGIIVSGAKSLTDKADYGNLAWSHFVYQDERLIQTSGDYPFVAWPGARGRPSRGDAWQDDVVERFEQVAETDLTELVLRQAFYYGYLKQILRKPFEDPYDVDAFIVGYQGAILSVEIKEKSPTEQGSFGVDAGRILMLLRLSLATDRNALYLIREVDTSFVRSYVAWRYITLADMIIGCNWNLQAGGRGMGGGATQTVMIHGELFKPFSPANFSEEWIDRNKSLQSAVRAQATTIATALSDYLRRAP